MNPIFSIMNNQSNPMIGYQPNNQVNQMNEMIHLFRNNPLLYQEFNKMVTQNNENFKSNNLFNENYLRTASKGEIPRNAFKQYKENNFTYNIETYDKFSKKINVKFQLSSGNRINMIVPETISQRTLFKEFITKIGFNKKILGKEIYFLCNGLKMDLNEERSLLNMKIFDGTIILVVDTKGILGAKNIIDIGHFILI